MHLFVNIGTAQPGTLDASFGSNGMVGHSFEYPPVYSYAGHAILEAPDGKILTVGKSSDAGALARFHADGTIDTLSDVNYWGFHLEGGALVFNGYHIFQLGLIEDPVFNDVALQPDGKMVIVGKILYESFYSRYILLRQNENGSYDNTFGYDIGGESVGYTIGPAAGLYDDLGHTVAIQPDGKILVGNEYFIVRHHSYGQVDSTFGTNGKLNIAFQPNFSSATMLLQPDGKILVAGGPSFAMKRYNPDGTIDTGFGTDGASVVDLTNETEALYSTELLPNGDVLAIGRSVGRLAVARFSNGQLDTDYGENGVVLVGLADKFITANSSVLQPDGKLVVAGYAGVEFEDDDHFFMARLTADGQLDDSFGDGGLVLADPTPGSDRLYGVNIQQDGKIIVTGKGGKQYGGSSFWASEYIVARYHSGLGVGATEKPASTNALMVSPNPTSDFLNFQLREQVPSSKAEFRIITADGKVLEVMKTTHPEAAFTLPVMDWPAGMYFLQFLEDGVVKGSEKFVVVK